MGERAATLCGLAILIFLVPRVFAVGQPAKPFQVCRGIIGQRAAMRRHAPAQCDNGEESPVCSKFPSLGEPTEACNPDYDKLITTI
jgi:hypothetical protein